MLAGKTAVVTGGGSGIGAAIARALTEAGAGVVIASRTEAKLLDLAEGLRRRGHRVWGVPVDVTNTASVRELASRAVAEAGAIDILVNSAGVAHSAPVGKIELSDWHRLFEVNVTGTLLATQAFLPAMVERGWGRIVNIASTAGLSGAKYIAAYSATKHAVIGFTRSVAAEVAPKGVTVNAVCPGYVDTPMTEESIARIRDTTGMSEAKARAAVLATSPQGRLLTPDEVAQVALALCAEWAKGITGQAIVVDGGALLS